MKKVIVISIDGMRPDGLMAAAKADAEYLMARGSYALDASSVMPTVTLPCHTSIFYGVVPARHGILSNVFVPQVHRVSGIFEKVRAAGGVSAIFYGWEPLRDVAPPGTCRYATYVNAYTDESVDTLLTDAAIKLIDEKKPDFVFLYMVDTDEKGGHDCGWMSEGYLERVRIAVANARRVVERYADEYTVIITADHGGHDRSHGTDMPEDLTIPMIFIGEQFTPGEALCGISLLDIAPTVAAVMGLAPEREWEGRSLTQGEV